MKRVACFGQHYQAEIARAVLEGAGLHPLEVPVAPHCTLGGAEQFYYVHVVEAELDDAKQVLKDNGYGVNIMN